MHDVAIHHIKQRYFRREIFTRLNIFIQIFYRFTGLIRRFIFSKKTFLCGSNFMLSKRSVPFSLGSFAFIALGGNHL